MKIKICGIKYKENLSEVIQLNPDFLGFNFYPASPRYMASELTPGDLSIISGNIKKTGIFVNQDEDFVSEIKWKYGLDYVQLHGNESTEMCNNLNTSGIRIIKAFSLNESFVFDTLIPYISCCDYFLFDTPNEKFGGSGKKFDWNLLEKYEIGHPWFLSGGIKPDDAQRILDLSLPTLAGVDINSGFESAPGIKNIDSLKIFFKDLNK